MNLLEFLVYFFAEVFMIYFLLNIFANIDKVSFKFCNTTKSKIIVSIFAILLIFNSMHNYTEYKLLITFLIMILLYYNYFKTGLRNSIYNAAIVISFNSILEILLSLIMFIGLANYIDLNNNELLKIAFSFIVFGTSNRIFYIEKVSGLVRKFKETLEQNISLEIILASIVVILNIFSFFRSQDFKNMYSIISIVIGIIYIILTSSVIVKSKFLVEKLVAKNKELSNSYKAYSETIQQFRELKHNLKNDLYGIKTNLPKEKQVYINDVILKYNKDNEWINNIEDMPEGLQGLIYLKKNEAEKNKVKMLINYKSSNKIQENDFVDLCDTIGILIDNAIEASKDLKNKIFLLDVNDINNNIEITITNSFTNKIDTTEIGNKNYSTKKKKSGLGLNYIKRINNERIKVKLSIINDLFITKIIYKAKN